MGFLSELVTIRAFTGDAEGRIVSPERLLAIPGRDREAKHGPGAFSGSGKVESPVSRFNSNRETDFKSSGLVELGSVYRFVVMTSRIPRVVRSLRRISSATTLMWRKSNVPNAVSTTFPPWE